MGTGIWTLDAGSWTLVPGCVGVGVCGSGLIALLRYGCVVHCRFVAAWFLWVLRWWYGGVWWSGCQLISFEKGVGDLQGLTD